MNYEQNNQPRVNDYSTTNYEVGRQQFRQRTSTINTTNVNGVQVGNEENSIAKKQSVCRVSEFRQLFVLCHMSSANTPQMGGKHLKIHC